MNRMLALLTISKSIQNFCKVKANSLHRKTYLYTSFRDGILLVVYRFYLKLTELILNLI